MPKSKEKKESRKRSVKSSDVVVKRTKSKNEGIEMSKQLLAKRAKSSRTGQTRASSYNNKGNEPRTCGNGKPMPSLSELEKMFGDSDDDTGPIGTKVTSDKSEVLPETEPQPVNPTPLSPESIKLISNKVLNLISNLPNEIISVEGDLPPTPVIPVKKYKKSDVPYIVGCKDRPQVIKKCTKVNFSGDKKYGVNSETNDFDQENECPKKRKRRGEPMNLSKSIFNAKSDEIAQALKANDDDDCDSRNSTDSNTTVSYDFNKSPSRIRSFSPLPSTSRDNVIFLKNDQRFNESYVDNSEVSCTTIKSPIISDEIILLDDDEPDVNANNKHNKSPVNLQSDSEDMYSSIDFEMKYNSDICEVIDVDDILAESRSIIAKHRNKTNLDKITLVDNVKSEPIDSEIITSSSSKALNQNNQIIEENSNAKHPETKLSEDSNTANKKDHDTVSNTTSNTSIIMEEIVTSFFRDHSKNENNPIPTIDLSDVGTSLERTMSAITKKNPRTLLQNVPSIDLVDCDITPQQPYTLSDSVINISSPSCIELNSPEPPISFFDPFSRNNRFQHSSTPLRNDSPRQRGRRQRGVNQRQPQTSGIANALNALMHIFDNANTTPQPRKRKRASTTAQKTNNCAANTSCQLPSQSLPDTGSASTNLPAPAPPIDSLRKTLGDCPICMENLNNGPIASTICGHLFCMNCIKVAIKANGKRCPNCRKTLKGVGYHQIFI